MKNKEIKFRCRVDHIKKRTYNYRILLSCNKNISAKESGLSFPNEDVNDGFRKFNVFALSMGNVMNFNIPLYYPNPFGGFIEMFADEEEWKRIEPHRGPLWLYEDLGHGGHREQVGTYDYCWDHKNKVPLATFDYDDKLIIELVEKINKNSTIIKRLKAGLSPEMSTEYYADKVFRDGKISQVNFRNSHGERRLEGIAIVEKGNCDAEHCLFERLDDDTAKKTREFQF